MISASDPVLFLTERLLFICPPCLIKYLKNDNVKKNPNLKDIEIKHQYLLILKNGPYLNKKKGLQNIAGPDNCI